MKRSEERILTTHVGSLIRPAELMAAGEAARGGGPGAEADYLELLQSVTAEVVKNRPKPVSILSMTANTASRVAPPMCSSG